VGSRFPKRKVPPAAGALGDGAAGLAAGDAGGLVPATGDFNMRPDDPLVEQLRGALRDAWRTAHPGLAQPATFRLASADEAPYCCDYVLVTPDLAPRVRAVRVDAETRASDHQPLLVELG
jgi:endonuclease/exonuclease/phosphatase family metal-dependent hydrolase